MNPPATPLMIFWGTKEKERFNMMDHLTCWSWTITLERSVGWTNVKSVPLRSISLEKNYFQTILCYFFSWKILVRSISRKNEYYENNHLPDSWMGENRPQQLIGDHGEAVLKLQLLDLSRQRLRWSFENISGNISICSQEGIVVDKKWIYAQSS